MTAQLQTYTQQEPSDEDVEAAKKWAVKIVNSLNHKQVSGQIVTLMLENMKLTAEVNDHRQARGFEPLPTYKP